MQLPITSRGLENATKYMQNGQKRSCELIINTLYYKLRSMAGYNYHKQHWAEWIIRNISALYNVQPKNFSLFLTMHKASIFDLMMTLLLKKSLCDELYYESKIQ